MASALTLRNGSIHLVAIIVLVGGRHGVEPVEKGFEKIVLVTVPQVVAALLDACQPGDFVLVEHIPVEKKTNNTFKGIGSNNFKGIGSYFGRLGACCHGSRPL